MLSQDVVLDRLHGLAEELGQKGVVGGGGDGAPQLASSGLQVGWTKTSPDRRVATCTPLLGLEHAGEQVAHQVWTRQRLPRSRAITWAMAALRHFGRVGDDQPDPAEGRGHRGAQEVDQEGGGLGLADAGANDLTASPPRVGGDR